MYIPQQFFTIPWLVFTHSLWFVILALAIWATPWRLIMAVPQRQHLFLAATLGLILLWSLEITVKPGLGFHFLGVTLFTLIFGWSLGVIGVVFASLGMLIGKGENLIVLAPNSLLLGMIPVSISYSVCHLVNHYLPRHLFIYIFLCGFLGAMVAAAIGLVALIFVLVATGAYSMDYVASNYLPFLPLYLFPEGLMNGMLYFRAA